jgi:SWI/SNF-related matrix-associated actin-dependent regulator 1 of chromatin subfamily A
LSGAEEAGIKAVEEMMMKQLEDGAKVEGGDVKELFKDGLIKAGVNIEE